MKKINMTGWIMSEHGVPDSKLTVIKEVEPHITTGGIHQIQYLCKCSCGNEIIVRGAYLRSGNTKSCGCLSKEKLIQRNIQSGTEIQIGDRFGHLTVIADLGMRKQKSRNKNWRWSLCQCDCGSQPIEAANNILKNGYKRSCGCIKSLGEDIIEGILLQYKCNFQREFKFEDCISPKGVAYRFDFAVLDDNNNLKFLIEFDGRQHYSGPEADWKNTRTLDEIKAADDFKNSYCKQNNLILKRIPYWQISEINFDSLMDNTFNINI